MIVSWKWLNEYIDLADVGPDEFARRMMMAGLNHESTEPRGADFAIDLEITSNRPDCLGHLGIAREASVLFGRELKIPAARPRESGAPVASLTKVRLDSPPLCPRYTARVIRGARVGPSPPWMRERLAALGIASVNNVVDATNYVLMECGQPLHAFDLAKLAGREIIVRAGRAGEKLEAIDHRTYELTPQMCVIADRDHAVAIAGIMGGAGTEVSPATTELLIESAAFDPSTIRAAARKLALHSDSSYRFERAIDPEAVDYASRRACEIILEIAGGEVAAGMIDVGRQPGTREPIVLRLPQLERIIGIDIPPERVRQILTALGNLETRHDANVVEVIPPSWRMDLTREIDLVEEVARIHGYEAIPEDVQVPMSPSARSAEDRGLAKARHVLTAAGFDEALTVSVVDPQWSEALSPWTDAPPLVSETPVLRRADCLRRSLIPSLLGARRTNETLANPVVELFEVARVYLPLSGGLPHEPLTLGLTSGGDFLSVKGVLETLVNRLQPRARLDVKPYQGALLATDRAAELWLDGERIAILGEVSAEGQKRFELRGETTVAEARLDKLLERADLVPRCRELSNFPSVSRDINLVVDERVRWADVAATAQANGGPWLESLDYRDTYRDAERLGPGRKSLLFSITLRKPDGTLTSAEGDSTRDQIVSACAAAHAAQLRA